MIAHTSLRVAVVTFLLAPLASAVAQSASPFNYPIPRIHREQPAEHAFGIQGYVVMMSECPPCPKNAVCATCPGPYIVVSRRNQLLNSLDRMTSQEVRLETNQISGFVLQKHYRLLIRNASGVPGDQGRRAFELVEFREVPAENPTLTRVADPALIERVGAVVQERLSTDFVLDHLPANSTLESGLNYLTTEAASDIVLEALTGVPTVYGMELATTHKRETLRLFVFATRPDFHGEIVYAEYHFDAGCPVFVASGPEPEKSAGR